MYLVRKYGGTSVATTAKIKQIADDLIATTKRGNKVVVVVSAMGKTTDLLIKLASEVNPEASGRELAALLATGEQQTAAILALALQAKGQSAVSMTGFQAGIETTADHQKSLIKRIDKAKIEQELNDNKIVVITGFQGVSLNKDITTLGRGGSDTTAVAFAVTLNCPCEIYTDVDGIYTCDPRFLPGARKLNSISYCEMIEMAALGAGVLETRSVVLAKKYKVELKLKKSLTRDGGTTVMSSSQFLEKNLITGLSIDENLIMTTIDAQNFSFDIVGEIFAILGDYKVNIDMITQNFIGSESLILTFSCAKEIENSLDQAIVALKQLKLKVTKEQKYAKISVVGIGMNSQSGVVNRIFKVLRREKIKAYHITTSEISISITVNLNKLTEAVINLAKEFDLQEN